METLRESFLNFLKPEVFFHNIFVIVVIRFLLLLLVLKLVHILLSFISNKVTSRIQNKEQSKQVHTIFIALKSLIDIVISALFVMEILPKFGIDIRPILTAAGVLGVAVGFGAKRLVEDIITGASLILEGQIRVGDIIEVCGKTGTVEKLNLKMLTLRDIEGKVYYIRNGMIDVVTNYTRDYSYATIDIGVAYKENIDNVIKTVVNISENELLQGECGQHLLGKIEVLGLDSFGDSSVNLKFRIRTQPTQQWAVAREFNRLIKNKFDELGIEIPFPQRTVHIEKAE